MPPNVSSRDFTGVLDENDAETIDGGLVGDIEKLKEAKHRKLDLVWFNIGFFCIMHIFALYGFWLMISSAKMYTNLFAFFLYLASGLGVTGGAHRLFAHRSYKANVPLRLLITFFNTIAYQNCVIHWARDHRVHHKFSETDADPHNATRGMFFAHMGWLLCRRHPDVLRKGKGVDMSDLEADPILFFQRKYYGILMPLCCFVLPTVIPVYYWKETWLNALFVAAIFRWVFVLHMTWLINSAAHMYGERPYDNAINPSENKYVAMTAFGEGFHNYHHVFPWDYKTAELGGYEFNFTCAFVDLMAKIGWAYELRTVSPEIIEKRVKRTGDGSHNVWGWGDKDQNEMERRSAIVTHKKK